MTAALASVAITPASRARPTVATTGRRHERLSGRLILVSSYDAGGVLTNAELVSAALSGDGGVLAFAAR